MNNKDLNAGSVIAAGIGFAAIVIGAGQKILESSFPIISPSALLVIGIAGLIVGAVGRVIALLQKKG